VLWRVLAVAIGLASLPSAAGAQEIDFWTGPYLGPTFGWGAGTASYTFLTDGWYNDAPGDTFEQPLSSHPMGGVLGYNWRTGHFVYGIEAFIHSHGVAAEGSCLVLFPRPPPGSCGDPSPFNPDHEFDFKGHWFTGLDVRAGYASNRWLLYGQAGFVLGHLVNSMQDLDNDYFITEYKAPASVFGVTGEVGVQLALTQRVSFGLGLRGTYLMPLHVSAESIDAATGDPAGPETSTNHTIQFSSHAIVARLIFRSGQSDDPPRRVVEPFDWERAYWGWYLGALWQIGLRAGYDHVINDRFVVGFSVQTSLNICCGYAFEGDLNARLGTIFRDNILFYAEAGVAMHTGTFFNVIEGGYYSIGGGVEIALTPRTTAFMELKGGGQPGQGLIDANFQGGLNFRIGR
jgi:opacity protein-like surface antigen